MKKLWLIPLFAFGLGLSPLYGQTITSFYGTSTSFIPNLYTDLHGYTLQWTGINLGGTETESYSSAFVTRGYDKITITAYGGSDTDVGTITLYGKVGSLSSNWIDIVSLPIGSTTTSYTPVAEGWTIMRIGKSGTGTSCSVEMDVLTKKK